MASMPSKPKTLRPNRNPVLDADDPALVRRRQNIPVWDREMLGGVYEELQGIRTYYSFPTIDVDRYSVEGSYRQVYLGAREIQFSKLPESAQNWINLHLQYTHGQGVVMIPAAQAEDEFMTWFIKDIPPRSEFGLSINRSSIYYGLEDKPMLSSPMTPERSAPRSAMMNPSSITTVKAESRSIHYGASCCYPCTSRTATFFLPPRPTIAAACSSAATSWIGSRTSPLF